MQRRPRVASTWRPAISFRWAVQMRATVVVSPRDCLAVRPVRVARDFGRLRLGPRLDLLKSRVGGICVHPQSVGEEDGGVLS